MQAQFVREVDGDVTFLKDGKLVIVPLDRLSEQDQKAIRELEANKKVEETAPPAGALRPELPPNADSNSSVAPGSAARPSLTTVRHAEPAVARLSRKSRPARSSSACTTEK